jgi:2-polyprenyl-6-methoxyphenol hydroxylase-like FAD-dependent oxidoreductase
LIGDAAHATSPHLGQGANLALEDAECLAQCLAHTSDINLAFAKFHRIRSRKTRFYRQLTAVLSPFFQSDSTWRSPLRNLVLPMMPSFPVVGRQMLHTLSGQKRGWLG